MGRRLTGTEALLWRIDSDPSLRSSFLNITLLDGVPDLDRLRRRMASATLAVPALGRYPVAGRAGVGAPHWAQVPDLDLEHHVQRRSLEPGDGPEERRLLDLAATVAEAPSDQHRPPWQLVVVDNLADGRAALLTKMSHAITDGVGGLRLSMQFLDLSPDPPEPLEPPVRPGRGRPASGADATAPAELDRDSRAALDRAWSTATAPIRMAGRTIGDAAEVARHPARLPSLAGDAIETARSLLRQMASEPAHSTLWADRSGRCQYQTLTFPLEEVRRTAHALGGTVNDVYVTALAAAAGAYHRHRGADVASLRVSIPVSTRADRSSAGNAFVPVRALVPTMDMSPTARFALVADRLAQTKAERAIGLTPVLNAALQVLPPPVVVTLARQQLRTVDFTASNLRGAPFELWVAGARVEANYPMGPLAGTAFNATVLSYLDRFDVGLNVDPAAVTDGAALRRDIIEAFAELAESARQTGASSVPRVPSGP